MHPALNRFRPEWLRQFGSAKENAACPYWEPQLA
jgi:hypothetical protein